MATKELFGGKFKDIIVTYKDDQVTKNAVFEKVLDWYMRVGSFSGECIMQCDTPQIEAPVLLSELADDIFQFDVTDKE